MLLGQPICPLYFPCFSAVPRAEKLALVKLTTRSGNAYAIACINPCHLAATTTKQQRWSRTKRSGKMPPLAVDHTATCNCWSTTNQGGRPPSVLGAGNHALTVLTAHLERVNTEAGRTLRPEILGAIFRYAIFTFFLFFLTLTIYPIY